VQVKSIADNVGLGKGALATDALVHGDGSGIGRPVKKMTSLFYHSIQAGRGEVINVLCEKAATWMKTFSIGEQGWHCHRKRHFMVGFLVFPDFKSGWSAGVLHRS
jgi:hypothetical protein